MIGNQTLDNMTQNDAILQRPLFTLILSEALNTGVLTASLCNPAMMACKSISIAGMVKLITNLLRINKTRVKILFAHQNGHCYQKSISFRYAVLGRLSRTLVNSVVRVTSDTAFTPIEPSKYFGWNDTQLYKS